MRIFGARKASAVLAISTTIFLAAGASAATIVMQAVPTNFSASFPDPLTWAMMLASFGLIGAGVRARKRTVVLS
jgi:hypothetical protein